MGTCCSKDESDKLEAIETKVRPKRHACPDMSKHVRILDKFLSPRVLTCWQRCIVSLYPMDPIIASHDCTMMNMIVTDWYILLLLMINKSLLYSSLGLTCRIFLIIEPSTSLRIQCQLLLRPSWWRQTALGTLGDLECALHRVHHVHCRPHCKPHSYKMSQRQSKAIKGLKFEDWCILTFKEPSSQISHSGDLLGKNYFQEESCRRNDKQSTKTSFSEAAQTLLAIPGLWMTRHSACRILVHNHASATSMGSGKVQGEPLDLMND
jgi:hypothetical protein